MSFDNIFDLTAGVYFNFYNIVYQVYSSAVAVSAESISDWDEALQLRKLHNILHNILHSILHILQGCVVIYL